MVSKFNLVFTDMDLLKQIIIYTKEPRQILKRRQQLDKEAEQFIHICLKFYKMNEEEYSYIYNDLHTDIERSISNRNIKCGDLNDRIPNPIDFKFIKHQIDNGYTFEKKHITKWIKENYKYLDDERLKRIRYFDGTHNYFSGKFCMKCEEYREYYLCNNFTEMGVFKCDWSICDDCIRNEIFKKNGLGTKLAIKEENKFNKKFN